MLRAFECSPSSNLPRAEIAVFRGPDRDALSNFPLTRLSPLPGLRAQCSPAVAVLTSGRELSSRNSMTWWPIGCDSPMAQSCSLWFPRRSSQRPPSMGAGRSPTIPTACSTRRRRTSDSGTRRSSRVSMTSHCESSWSRHRSSYPWRASRRRLWRPWSAGLAAIWTECKRCCARKATMTRGSSIVWSRKKNRCRSP